MSTKRQEAILQLLKERKFITVQELSRLLFISPSSIRRDLALLQNSGLVIRTHGGVTPAESFVGVPSFYDRKTKNVPEKRQIAQKAAEWLKNGQKILLDGSSTVTFLLPYIARLESATLFTNNLLTATAAIQLGIRTHCIGGVSFNGSPAMLGAEACKTVAGLYVDILFFSSQSVDENGVITDSTEEENYLRSLMLLAAEKRVFLCDSSKFGRRSAFTLTTLSQVDAFIFNKPFAGLHANTRHPAKG